MSGLVVGGSIFAFRYAQRKLHEFQLDQAKEFLEKTRRTQHFESTEHVCNQVITNLAPTLCEEIIRHLDTDTILDQLRKNPENKAELWNELKIIAFARVTTLVYAASMLVVSLRVQVNLLGGYLYKDSVAGGDSDPKLPQDLQQKYLSEIQYFLGDGVKNLAQVISEVTRKILQDYNLKKKLTVQDVEQIFWSIQMSVNSHSSDPNSHLNKYIFGLEGESMPESHGNLNPLTKRLLLETTDVLDSDEVSVLSSNNVSRGFTIVVDSLAEYLFESIAELSTKQPTQPVVANGGANGSLPNLSNIHVALARIIPIVNGLTSKPFNATQNPQNLATSLITLFMLSDKVKMLGVNVYELFSV